MNLDTVRKTFTDCAPFYNPTHGWTLPKRRAARLALGLRPGDRVLDLARGAPRGAIKQYLKGKETIRKVSSMPQYC